MESNEFRNFRIERDARGVLTAWIDLPDSAHNVFNQSVMEELQGLVGRLEGDRDVKLVVFRSAKESGFLAGADVATIQSLKSGDDVEPIIAAGQELFERIERLPFPTIAAIHGPCLGGGLEFALACRYRVARDDSSTRLGLPEIQLGLMPGWGGTQRLPKQIGLASALRLILGGSKVSAAKAKRQGLVDVVARGAHFDDDLERFIVQCLAGRTVTAPRQSLVGRLRDRTRVGQFVVLQMVRRRTARQVKHYPAVAAVIEAVETGLKRSRDAGLAVERKRFAELLFTPTCRNLLGLFFQRERARKPETWLRELRSNEEAVGSADVDSDIQRIGILGAGTMGAGIAQLAAYQGFDVVLRDINTEAVNAGMSKIRKLMADSVRKGALREEEAEQRLQSITSCTDWEPLHNAQLVVEAVVEREDIKREVFQKLDANLPADSILVSNTSALSVSGLAAATERADRVAGLHFFNPVHRMQLVEVVQARETSASTIAALVGVVRRLGKVPIVVQDRPGFLVNRILFPYLDEAVRMVCEGTSVEQIDREARQFGMPMGPLELLDQVGLDVAVGVAGTLTAKAIDDSPTPSCLAQLVEQGSLGKKSDRGFYVYKQGKRSRPAELRFQSSGGKPTVLADRTLGGESLTGVQQRLVGQLINESSRCLEERVVEDAWMVDLAMVLGTGFAPFRGGPCRVADHWGSEATMELLIHLRETLGARFEPSGLLRDLCAQNTTFYPAAPRTPDSKTQTTEIS